MIEAFVGSGYDAGAYSFNFFSRSGYLDHGLASQTMTPQVTGAAFLGTSILMSRVGWITTPLINPGFFDKAVQDYEEAWENAVKAL